MKEFRTERPRAGFVPGYDADVETWQVWCRSAENPDHSRRATRGDMAAAGYVRAPKSGAK